MASNPRPNETGKRAKRVAKQHYSAAIGADRSSAFEDPTLAGPDDLTRAQRADGRNDFVMDVGGGVYQLDPNAQSAGGVLFPDTALWIAVGG